MMNEKILKEFKDSLEKEPVSLLEALMQLANSGALDRCKGVNPSKQSGVKEATAPSVKEFKNKMLENLDAGSKVLSLIDKNNKEIEQLERRIEELKMTNEKLEVELEKLSDKKDAILMNFLNLK